MTDEEFIDRLKILADKTSLSKEDKLEKGSLIAAACDTDEHERLIIEQLNRNDITFDELYDFVFSIIPPVEIVDGDSDEEE